MLPDNKTLRATLCVVVIGASSAMACTAGAPTGDGDGDASSGSNSSGSGSGSGKTTDDVGDSGISITGADSGDITDKPPSDHCGDGVLDDDEACDDGTPGGGDGCGSNCLFVEEGFICADAGEPCRPYSKCGDGIVAFPEQCDPGGDVVAGCSDTCKLELGFKCTGSPSACEPTVCGDGAIEGTETCEDGNTIPFDGCDANCNKEPDCASMSGMGCTSACGDGLIIGAEECDDGNSQSGDGCSADCKKEDGYTCTVPEVDPDEPLNLPIVFRDFSVGTPSDFKPPDPLGTDNRPCDGYSPGEAKDMLNNAGKPVFNSAPPKSCVTPEGFAEWYTESDDSDTILSSIMLYPNGKGGYVNRYGVNGEQYITSVKTPDERNAGTSAATCETACRGFARDAQPPFQGDDPLRCDDLCRSLVQTAQQLEDNDLVQAQNRLTQAENAMPVDEDLVATIEAEIADIEDQITAAQADADACASDCNDQLDAKTAECAATCAPCSDGSGNWCIGGEQLALDGNPLFFPIDEGTQARSPDSQRSAARIPAQVYQGLGWPWENPACDAGEICKSPLHNFAFTSEIAYWFEYNADTVADLTFLGDDDVFVFINRHLVLDIGGIHVPLGGELNLLANGTYTTRVWEPLDPGDDAPVPMKDITGSGPVSDLGLEPGKVYEIKVFHAERKPEGSSFQLTLAGFNAGRSTCVATCGDGVIAGGEQCDDGAENNTGGHNKCNEDCSLGSFCGDGQVQAEDGEQCDDNAPDAPPDCSNCRLGIVR